MLQGFYIFIIFVCKRNVLKVMCLSKRKIENSIIPSHGGNSGFRRSKKSRNNSQICPQNSAPFIAPSLERNPSRFDQIIYKNSDDFRD